MTAFSPTTNGIAPIRQPATDRLAIVPRQANTPRCLTVLSFVPDLTSGFDAGSAVTLMTLHLLAAVIVIPALARQLAPSR